MEKVVHLVEIFKTIIYFKFFELGKVTFQVVKFDVIRMEFESVSIRFSNQT
jgi:hypothetical protein